LEIYLKGEKLRLPPYNEEAERGVLGSALIESERVLKLCGEKGITSESFYIPSHRILFNELQGMKCTSVIDLLTVSDSLRKNGMLDQVGGDSFLEGLIDSTPTSAHAEYYMEIIQPKQQFREIITQSAEAIDECYTSEDPSAVIAKLTSTLVGMVDVKQDVTTDSIVDNCRAAASGNIKNIQHPFEGLTRITGGVKRGMVTILTGRSKSGKSMYKSFWQKHLGLIGTPTLDMCFEDGIEIARMRCASIGKFCSSDLMNGGRYVKVGDKWEWWKNTEDDISKMEKALRELDTLPMYWHERRVAPNNLLSTVSEYVNRHKIECVFIDGAKDMLRPSGKYNDCGFEEETSQTIVDMAQRLNIAVVVIHHLTKLSPNELITEGNVRGSGNIVSDCRSIYALQGDKGGAGLDQYMNPLAVQMDGDENCTTRVLDCLANNHGKAGKTWLECDLGKCDFWKKI